MQYSPWYPTRPPSAGASAYHNAVVNKSWHRENIKGLIYIVRKKIKSSDIVVDFGAGTGASAIYLLKFLTPTSRFMLVDNSPSWLGKAYEILHENTNTAFFLLEKKANRYIMLDELFGKNAVDHVVSANTVHLIPDIQKTFNGIYAALKNQGTFTFQSGNIISRNKEKGILRIDDSINRIHDIALKIVRTDNAYKKYKKGLARRIKEEKNQRTFVFPKPRPVTFYLKALKSAGFKNEMITYKYIKIKYKDWLDFLRVRRLQAGILPEIGGKNASLQEEHDRDMIITQSARLLFNMLKTQNPLANAISFTAEWIYIQAEK